MVVIDGDTVALVENGVTVTLIDRFLVADEGIVAFVENLCTVLLVENMDLVALVDGFIVEEVTVLLCDGFLVDESKGQRVDGFFVDTLVVGSAIIEGKPHVKRRTGMSCMLLKNHKILLIYKKALIFFCVSEME